MSRFVQPDIISPTQTPVGRGGRNFAEVGQALSLTFQAFTLAQRRRGQTARISGRLADEEQKANIAGIKNESAVLRAEREGIELEIQQTQRQTQLGLKEAEIELQAEAMLTDQAERNVTAAKMRSAVTNDEWQKLSDLEPGRVAALIMHLPPDKALEFFNSWKWLDQRNRTAVGRVIADWLADTRLREIQLEREDKIRQAGLAGAEFDDDEFYRNHVKTFANELLEADDAIAGPALFKLQQRINSLLISEITIEGNEQQAKIERDASQAVKLGSIQFFKWGRGDSSAATSLDGLIKDLQSHATLVAGFDADDTEGIEKYVNRELESLALDRLFAASQDVRQDMAAMAGNVASLLPDIWSKIKDDVLPMIVEAERGHVERRDKIAMDAIGMKIDAATTSIGIMATTNFLDTIEDPDRRGTMQNIILTAASKLRGSEGHLRAATMVFVDLVDPDALGVSQPAGLDDTDLDAKLRDERGWTNEQILTRRFEMGWSSSDHQRSIDLQDLKGGNLVGMAKRYAGARRANPVAVARYLRSFEKNIGRPLQVGLSVTDHLEWESDEWKRGINAMNHPDAPVLLAEADRFIKEREGHLVSQIPTDSTQQRWQKQFAYEYVLQVTEGDPVSEGNRIKAAASLASDAISQRKLTLDTEDRGFFGGNADIVVDAHLYGVGNDEDHDKEKVKSIESQLKLGDNTHRFAHGFHASEPYPEYGLPGQFGGIEGGLVAVPMLNNDESREPTGWIFVDPNAPKGTEPLVVTSDRTLLGELTGDVQTARDRGLDASTISGRLLKQVTEGSNVAIALQLNRQFKNNHTTTERSADARYRYRSHIMAVSMDDYNDKMSVSRGRPFKLDQRLKEYVMNFQTQREWTTSEWQGQMWIRSAGRRLGYPEKYFPSDQELEDLRQSEIR